MKMFSQYKLTRELILFFTFRIIILLYFAFSDYYYSALHVQAQLQQQKLPPVIGVKITSPVVKQVPIGQLAISGTSTDNPTTDCTVYADWNNTKPFQKAIATGPGGADDYSTWTFTYTDKYHLITNGTNNLTSKLSCINDNSSTANLTKNYSVNVIGVAANTTNNMIDGTISREEGRQQTPESFTIERNNITTAISNETTTVIEEEQGITAKDNISSLTSIPIPLVANDFAFDRINVNITSHKSGQQVPVGNLTIAGHSSDNITNDCTVYTNWNGQNPLQIAKALGPGGADDYSTWSFTYTPAYHAITNGTNELTAQISCLEDEDSNTNNTNNNKNTTATYLTNYYRVNVTGITKASSSERTTSSEEQKEQTNGVGSSSIPIPTPSPLASSPSTQKQEEKEDKDVEKEEPEPEPQPEPEPEPQPESEPQAEPEPEDNDDTTIYWDIEEPEDNEKNNEQILDSENYIFDLQ
jgi:hypothetical protein